MEREESSRTFQQVAADFFSSGNQEYLAYVDRASGWISVFSFNKVGVITKLTSATATIKKRVSFTKLFMYSLFAPTLG